jgi:hypothetical protein
MNILRVQAWTRRRFLIVGLCSVAGVVVGSAVATGRRHSRRRTMAVFRNPAFVLRRRGTEVVLVCRDASGREAAYRMDEHAAQFWGQVPTAEEFGLEGRRETIETLVKRVAGASGGRGHGWKRDAYAFVEEGLRQGIFLRDDAAVYLDHVPPLSPTRTSL